MSFQNKEGDAKEAAGAGKAQEKGGVTAEDLESFEFKIDPALKKLHAADVDQQIASDIHLKTVHFETHEFVKMNRVSQFITDAIKTVELRLDQKEKMANASKAMMRNMDMKQKQLETSVNMLLKM